MLVQLFFLLGSNNLFLSFLLSLIFNSLITRTKTLQRELCPHGDGERERGKEGERKGGRTKPVVVLIGKEKYTWLRFSKRHGNPKGCSEGRGVDLGTLHWVMDSGNPLLPSSQGRRDHITGIGEGQGLQQQLWSVGQVGEVRQH